MRRDLGSESTAGLVFTDRTAAGDFNRVAGADARLVFGGIYSVAMQAAGSFTRAGGSAADFAPLVDVGLERRGRELGFSANFRALSPDFVAGSGFISRVGLVQANVGPQFTRFGSPGAAMESHTISLYVDGTWKYDRFFGGGGPQEVKLHLGNNFALRGGWRLGGTVLLESFGYPEELYENHWIERRAGAVTDTVRFTGGERIPNLDFVFNLTTPRFPRFSGSLFLILGRDENFYEWAPAYVVFTTAEVEWRPTDKLRVDGRFDRQQYSARATGAPWPCAPSRG